ncbi:hypothetical protein I6A60_35180 [Frankia sp. AgB1.9]|uniref:hypothetical protein n=1 Tax=unclassified Frankia TaxID=2632575 RepID=UPI001934666B|nr:MULTISPECIES: hypothetical protein [unclassified Frankia]MBL7493804.1 hypothetical protein [Frankia sp. AgW1.1]MBL7553056.1 hypothetical protein [Frankia sp. AgB1.9]MBL7618929.1 hypothetical protein [Frankia sp. AgB1.8]
MRRSWIPPVAVPLGVAAGFVGAHLVLVGSGLILIPWGLLAAVLGLGARGRRSAAATGGLFGFALAVTFMIAGYDGAAPLTSRLAPFALLGLVGAAGAVIPSLGARLLAGRLARAV